MTNEEIKCTILEIAYFKMKKYENMDVAISMLPMGWASSKNYNYKIEMLIEAIDKGIYLSETDLYKKEVEGKIIY